MKMRIKHTVITITSPNMIFHCVGMMMLLLMAVVSLASASMTPPQLSSAVMRVSHRSSQSTDSRLLSQIYDIRGGSDSSNENQPSTSSASGEPSSSYTTYDAAAQQQQSQINNPNFQSTSSASLSPPSSTLAPPQVGGDYDSSMNDAPTTNADQPMMYGYNRETVEDRIDAWRKQQQVKESKNDYLLFIVCIFNDRCILIKFCPTRINK